MPADGSSGNAGLKQEVPGGTKLEEGEPSGHECAEQAETGGPAAAAVIRRYVFEVRDRTALRRLISLSRINPLAYTP